MFYTPPPFENCLRFADHFTATFVLSEHNTHIMGSSHLIISCQLYLLNIVESSVFERCGGFKGGFKWEKQYLPPIAPFQLLLTLCEKKHEGQINHICGTPTLSSLSESNLA